MLGFIPADSCEYAIEYLPAAAMTPKIGMALAFSSGKLAASATPEYICMRAGGAVSAGDNIPVLRINKNMKFQAVLDGSTSFTAGTIAQITSDGLKVDADGSTAGVFQITELDGTAEGDTVRGYFVQQAAAPEAPESSGET